MKTHFKIYNLAAFMLAVTLLGCESTLSPDNDETLKASFVKAYMANGVVEGKINESIDITVEFNHPLSNLSVKSVEKNVIDSFTTRYLIIAEESDNTDPFDVVTVSYDINETGSHTLDFYYKLKNKEDEEFLGKFEFAIDQ